jgi:hypothetical protein
MTLYRVSLACILGVALAACSEVEQGVLAPSPARAALRYVNLVPDTGAVDFRIIDIIGDAPVAGAATFRTGGQPYGNATNFLPPHFPVLAGARHIRVFPSSMDPAVSSRILLDTTFTFLENVYYTFYLYRGSPKMQALITVDDQTAPTGTAFRVINLGGSSADVDIIARNATVPLTATTATFAGVLPGATTAYVPLAVSTSYRGLLSTPGARSTFLVSTYAPEGVVGTATVNPVAGTAVAGTSITAVIVPASVAGTGSPVTGNPTLRTANLVTRSSDSVLVQTGYTTTIKNKIWRVGIDTGRTLDTTYTIRTGNAGIDTIIKYRRRADSAATAVGVTHGFAVGDQANVAGATQPEYNGWHYVMQLADSTTCLPADTVADVRRSCALLAADTLRVLRGDTTPPLARFYTSTVRSRFRYRIGVQTPASPATGTVTYRAYPAASQPQPGLSNYTIPWIIYLIDRKPTLTAP